MRADAPEKARARLVVRVRAARTRPEPRPFRPRDARRAGAAARASTAESSAAERGLGPSAGWEAAGAGLPQAEGAKSMVIGMARIKSGRSSLPMNKSVRLRFREKIQPGQKKI